MRLIGTLASQDDALTFTDYLITINMPAQVDQGRDGTWQVWIARDDDVEQGQLQLREYLANPGDPKYADVATRASRVRKEMFEQARKRQQNFKDVRTTQAGKSFAPAVFSTIFLIACILVAVLTKVGYDEDGTAMEWLRFQPASAVTIPGDMNQFRDDVAKFHPWTMFSAISSGQVWRLITPIFIHYGPIHLLFNMMWLTSLGSAIERVKGPTIFFILVIVAGVAGNVGEALWTVYGPGNPIGFASFGGFSGVVYAFFGYVWLKGKLQPYEGLAAPPQTVGLMLTWLVLCIMGVLGNIANAAHVVGLIVGVIFGSWPTLMRRIKAS